MLWCLLDYWITFILELQHSCVLWELIYYPLIELPTGSESPGPPGRLAYSNLSQHLGALSCLDHLHLCILATGMCAGSPTCQQYHHHLTAPHFSWWLWSSCPALRSTLYEILLFSLHWERFLVLARFTCWLKPLWHFETVSLRFASFCLTIGEAAALRAI